MLNPICEVRIDEIIDRRRTHRGVAVAALIFHKKSHYVCDVFVEEFPAGFLSNLLMHEEISAVKITGRHNGKKLVRFKAIPWSYQRDELKSKLLGTILNAIGSDIDSIPWREGESLAVGEGNELAKRLEKLLRNDVANEQPEDEFDF